MWRIIPLIALLSACASADYKPMALCHASGEVMVLDAEPVKPFKTCGVIEINTSALGSKESALKAIKEQAKKVGANAVIITQLSEYNFTAKDGGGKQSQAIAIQQ